MDFPNRNREMVLKKVIRTTLKNPSFRTTLAIKARATAMITDKNALDRVFIMKSFIGNPANLWANHITSMVLLNSMTIEPTRTK